LQREGKRTVQGIRALEGCSGKFSGFKSYKMQMISAVLES
jgi:hypothetical protein